MHESLEDYIKFNKNTKQEPFSISKEMIVTAQLKKECDARAVRIVEFCIEGKLRSEIFKKSLHYINSSHYQDIIEERAITKLCGYPICGNRIPEMPKKQYYISTKSNRVYDITERKNFCSNFCYKASLHIKNQISSSPLWLRKLEDMPDYNLLHPSSGGLPGKYIDQGIIKLATEPKFTSISTFAEASLDNILEVQEQPERDKNPVSDRKSLKKTSKLKSTMQTITENVVEEDVQLCNVSQTNSKSDKSSNVLKKESHLQKKNCVCSLPAIEEQEIEDKVKSFDLNEKKGISKRSQKIREPILIDAIENIRPKNKSSPLSNSDRRNSLKNSDINTENLLNDSLSSWLTLETCIYLHGEKKVKEILSEEQLEHCFDDLHVMQLQMEQQMKYMQICRRLKLQEMAEEKFNQATTSGSYKLKPLPDFKKLKEDTRDMNLKVKCFLNGMEYPLQKLAEDDNKENKTEENCEPKMPTVMPQTDNNSKIVMRRKIFLNSINKVLQQILPALEITYFQPILSDVQELIKTFNLKADNVTFKPKVWNYIGLILLYLLSIKDKSLHKVLMNDRSKDYVAMMMFSLPSQMNYLNYLIERISNIPQFTKQYITKE